MSYRYFVIGAGSIGRRHADNLSALGVDVTHYAWRGIDFDALISNIAACNGKAGVVIATATNVRLALITECAKAGAAHRGEPSRDGLIGPSRPVSCP